MRQFFERFIARAWNRHAGPHPNQEAAKRGLDLGARVVDGDMTGSHVRIPQNRRAEHLVLLGKTGSGKSYLIRYLAEQDINAGRGFVFFDLHGDVTPFLVKTVAARERSLQRDLSDRLIIIDPSDPEYSPGLNALEGQTPAGRFIQIAEFSEILKERWHLDTFGARTDELLRNALFVLSENGFTLVELGPFLSDQAFRSRCVSRTTNTEIREYFEIRYDRLSDAMRRVMAEPVLNKIGLFLSDSTFRHLLGQQQSTFNLPDAMDRNCWVVLNLDKGRLAEHGATFGSLFLTKVKHAFFARRSRDIFTVFVDEVQNLVAKGSALEILFAEVRKRGGAVVSANQFLAQLPTETQAALMSAGSFGFFQLSGADAQQISGMLDGGKSLAERLKNLPRRHLIAKTVPAKVLLGNGRWRPQSDLCDFTERGDAHRITPPRAAPGPRSDPCGGLLLIAPTRGE